MTDENGFKISDRKFDKLSKERKGNWITTYTGRRFWPVDPHTEDIDINDIAHALSNVCRFNGHCRSFYSVAQHSVLVSKYCKKENALIGLLHDASEAYICDLAKPIKESSEMAEYKVIEANIMSVVFDKFNLSEISEDVHIADKRLLVSEVRDLISNNDPKNWPLWMNGTSIPQVISPVSPIKAERAFLNRYYELTNEQIKK